jgi:uncharacterized membrane protein
MIGLALASGAAGAYSFAEKKGEILVGVMIAVALVPPASVVGIGIALLDSEFILSSGLILAVNVFCINIAGTLVFWRLGIRPGSFLEMMFSEKDIKKRLVITLIILVILGTIFGWSTYITYQNYQLEKNIESEISTFIQEGNYTSIVQYEVDEIDLGRNIFGIESEKPIEVKMILYYSEEDNSTDRPDDVEIEQHLNEAFSDQNKRGFNVNIFYQEVSMSH